MAQTLLKERPETARENYFGLSDSVPLTICGPDGTGEPDITEMTFGFNGDTNYYLASPEDYSYKADAAHESFHMDLLYAPSSWQLSDPDVQRTGLYFNFCKTAQKPYDLLVCACLLALKFVFPEVEVSSDGEADNWAAAVQFFQQTFEIPAPKGGPWVADEAA